jgi:hypothetical protein
MNCLIDNFLGLYLKRYVSLWYYMEFGGEAQCVFSMDRWKVPYYNKGLILNMVSKWKYKES